MEVVGGNAILLFAGTWLVKFAHIAPSVYANNSAWSLLLFLPTKCYTAGSIKASPITRRQTPLLDGTSDQKLISPFLMYKNVHTTWYENVNHFMYETMIYLTHIRDHLI